MPLTSAYWPVPFVSVVQSVVMVMLLEYSLKCGADDRDAASAWNSSARTHPLPQPFGYGLAAGAAVRHPVGEDWVGATRRWSPCSGRTRSTKCSTPTSWWGWPTVRWP